MSVQLNFNNEELKTEQHFTLVYSGPTFKSGIKLDMFIENLESIRRLIYTIADVNLEYQSGYNKGADIKQIKIVPKSGSIEEQIIVIFSKPELRDAVLTVLISLFFYLLGKRDSKKSDEITDNKLNKIEEQIEDLIARDQDTNIRNLYMPLEKAEDKLSITENSKVELEIEFNQKTILDNSIKHLKEELKAVETIEELNGQISAINIDTNYLKFHAVGMEYAYPLYFDVPISKLVHLIAVPIKAKMKVRRVKNKVKNFYLIEYKNLQRGINETQN